MQLDFLDFKKFQCFKKSQDGFEKNSIEHVQPQWNFRNAFECVWVEASNTTFLAAPWIANNRE